MGSDRGMPGCLEAEELLSTSSGALPGQAKLPPRPCPPAPHAAAPACQTMGSITTSLLGQPRMVPNGQGEEGVPPAPPLCPGSTPAYSPSLPPPWVNAGAGLPGWAQAGRQVGRPAANLVASVLSLLVACCYQGGAITGAWIRCSVQTRPPNTHTHQAPQILNPALPNVVPPPPASWLSFNLFVLIIL